MLHNAITRKMQILTCHTLRGSTCRKRSATSKHARDMLHALERVLLGNEFGAVLTLGDFILALLPHKRCAKYL